MKHPSDIAWPEFEPRCYRSVANHTTSWAMEAPSIMPVSFFCLVLISINILVYYYNNITLPFCLCQQVDSHNNKTGAGFSRQPFPKYYA